MGFMDKAKKMAEQAQAKLDDAQKQFNQPSGDQQQAGGGPAVEYDKHGRPIPSEPPATATPPHGDPVGPPDAAAPPPPQAAPTPDPAAPPSPPKSEGEEDPNRPSYAPPKMTSGDPLG
jgi:formin 2/WAS/WASL-interacting protein